MTDFDHAIIALGAGGEADTLIAADVDVTIDASGFSTLSTDDTDLQTFAEDVDATIVDATAVAAAVTFENLDDNSDVGTGAAQVAAGDHTHAGGAGATFVESAGNADLTTSYANIGLPIPVVAAKVTWFEVFIHGTSITNGQVFYVSTDDGVTGATVRLEGYHAIGNAGEDFDAYFAAADQMTNTVGGSGEGIFALRGIIYADGSHGGNLQIQCKTQDGSGVILPAHAWASYVQSA